MSGSPEPYSHDVPDDRDEHAHLWRIALFVTGFFAIWSLAVFLVWRPGWFDGKQDGLIENIVKISVWLGFAFLAAKLAGARQPYRWMGFYPIAPRVVGVTVIAVAVLLAKDLVRAVWIEGRSPDWQAFASHVAPASLTGVLEETLFRGAILAWLATRLGSVRGVVIDTTLFFLIHVPGWLILQVPVSAQKAAVVMAVGLVCGKLRQLTKSLWPPIGAHAANNAGSWF
jgi:membrane protease YdiL (CAAX protease family)